MKRWHIYIIFLILILPLSFSLSEPIECQRVMTPQDMPCSLITSWKPSTGCISNVSFYQNGSIINIYPYGDYDLFCNATINITEIGTYTYNSSIISGIITIKNEDNMLSIVFSIGFIILFFIALGIINTGFKLKFFSYAIALIETIFMFSLVYAREINIDISGLMRVNFWIILIIGFGIALLSLFLHSLNIVNLEHDDMEETNKWNNRKKWD